MDRGKKKKKKKNTTHQKNLRAFGRKKHQAEGSSPGRGRGGIKVTKLLASYKREEFFDWSERKEKLKRSSGGPY